MNKTESLEIQSRKSYNIRIPNYKKQKVHIDYILKNPVDDCVYSSLVICRVWLKGRKRFEHFCFLYFELAIYNDWEYELKEQ